MILMSGNFAGGEHNGEALHDMPNRRVDGDRARHFDCCIDAAKLGVARFARLRSDRRRDLTAAMLILTAKALLMGAFAVFLRQKLCGETTIVARIKR